MAVLSTAFHILFHHIHNASISIVHIEDGIILSVPFHMFEVLQFLDFDGAEYLLCLHLVSLVSFVGSYFLVRHSIYAHLYGQTSVKYSTFTEKDYEEDFLKKLFYLN